MATQSEILMRRRELCNYRFRGFPLDKVSRLLSNKYGVAESRIKKDWYSRRDWLEQVFDIDLEDAELIIMDILSEEKEIKNECWRLYRNTDNEPIKLGSIKQLRQINKELIEILQSIGVVQKTADKLELESKQLIVEMPEDYEG